MLGGGRLAALEWMCATRRGQREARAPGAAWRRRGGSALGTPLALDAARRLAQQEQSTRGWL